MTDEGGLEQSRRICRHTCRYIGIRRGSRRGWVDAGVAVKVEGAQRPVDGIACRREANNRVE